ncbi:uncharacterized protein [Temnothorax nylanderi]|uniref:uncharacterized protein n=1 Tax=Temnothorax nylanderi TaxID=102681 RepID=UPI003A883194
MSSDENLITSSQDSPNQEIREEVRETPVVLGVVQNVEKIKRELLKECNRRAYLDGTYFSPDLDKSSLIGTIVGICQLCKRENNKFHTINGSLKIPSNYVSHIKKVHKHKRDEYEEYAQQKKMKVIHEAEQYKTYCHFSQAQFEENVINYILENIVPFSTVESKSFRKIFDDMEIKKGGKRLAHLSARTVERRIHKTFKENISSIKKMISEAENVCTTAAVWSCQSRRFLGMTVHWIDNQTMERKSYAIACRRFSGTHSYDRVARFIEDIHTSFGINKNKIIATVTDNGSNFVKAFREFGVNLGDLFFSEEISDDKEVGTNFETEFENEEHAELELFEEKPNDYSEEILPQHFRCASHTLNLLATSDVISLIKSSKELNSAYTQMIERCNELWNLQLSPKKYEKLKEVFGQSLKRPVITRWNSLYRALLQIFSLKEKILTNIDELGINKPLDEIGFRFMEEYLHCNRPLAEAIDILQGEKVASYGYLLPTLISVKNKLLACQKIKLQFCKKLVSGLLKSLQLRFKPIFDVENEGRISAVAAASHPKFKLNWLNCLSRSAQANVMVAIKEGLTSVSSRIKDKKKDHSVAEDDFFDFTCDYDTPDVVETFGASDVEAIFQKFSTESRNDLELLNLYPIVKEVFLKFNTPLPSSAPVERLLVTLQCLIYLNLIN